MPRGRSDLALGAAVRVPVGDLVAQPSGEDRDLVLALGAPGGVAPLAFVRHGLTPYVDLGLDVTGSTMRAAARGRIGLGTVNLMGALEPFGGLASEAGTLGRVGVALPLTLSLDVLSVVEAWIGVRVAVEHVFGESGEASARSVSLLGVRAGGVVGLALGFRRFHVLCELGVDHEYWTGTLGGASLERNGVALTPAFGLRLRL